MYSINSNILGKTGYTGAQLKAATLKLNPKAAFKDYDAFAKAEAKYGINSVFILAHAIIESAWGSSYYATARNNLFGFNAIDSNPDNASSYSSQGAAIDYYASFLKKYYLTQGAAYYAGATPHGVFVHYSSSHDSEATSVVGIMNKLVANLPAGRNTMADIFTPNQVNTLIAIAYNRQSTASDRRIYTKNDVNHTLADVFAKNKSFRAKASQYDAVKAALDEANKKLAAVQQEPVPAPALDQATKDQITQTNENVSWIKTLLSKIFK